MIWYIHTDRHYIALHYITPHGIALHYIALHCITLHCITLHCIASHCIALHCIALHCIALHYIALHCIALHCITLHYIALHFIALHCIASHKRKKHSNQDSRCDITGVKGHTWGRKRTCGVLLFVNLLFPYSQSSYCIPSTIACSSTFCLLNHLKPTSFIIFFWLVRYHPLVIQHS